ncbi:MAG: T9SS type A sorting domain-containing protein [Bacteroidales bacterium]|nr:T9SS type A sorting domain-containing protein [Bacteroidales bacterium]
MKKFFTFLLPLWGFLMLFPLSKAQNSFPVPNGDFESWTMEDGYYVHIPIQNPFGGGSITLNYTVYDSCATPTYWNHPVYPISESVSIGGNSTSIDTDLPLLKVYKDTIDATTNQFALKMETFMISDIFTSTIYSFVQNSLSEDLKNTIFPTILSTGAIEMDQFFSLLNSIIDNLGSTEELLSIFQDADLNDYVKGGIALNGFVPGKLTGQYKYASDTIGDNGGIILLGSSYDNVSQRRIVVGGGFSVALTDTTDYTPFEVRYQSINELDGIDTYPEADSLIIFMFSSVGLNMQQHSALYLDNLKLWEPDPVITDSTCSGTYDLSVVGLDTTHAQLSWSFVGEPDHWEYKYGEQGFAEESVEALTTDNNSVSLSELQPDTYYDVYVRSVCEEEIYGAWAMTSFKTDTLIPPTIVPGDSTSVIPGDSTTIVPGDSTSIRNCLNNSISVFPNPAHGQCTIQFHEQQPSNVQLFSMDGKLLMSLIPKNETLSIELPYSGIFLLRCKTEKGIIIRRIINF